MFENIAVALSSVVLRSIPDSLEFSFHICCAPSRRQIVRLRFLRSFHFLRFPNLGINGRMLLKWTLDWVRPNIPVLHLWRCFPPKADPRTEALRYFETSDTPSAPLLWEHETSEWTDLAQVRDRRRALVISVMNHRLHYKVENCSTAWGTVSFSGFCLVGVQIVVTTSNYRCHCAVPCKCCSVCGTLSDNLMAHAVGTTACTVTAVSSAKHSSSTLFGCGMSRNSGSLSLLEPSGPV